MITNSFWPIYTKWYWVSWANIYNNLHGLRKLSDTPDAPVVATFLATVNHCYFTAHFGTPGAQVSRFQLLERVDRPFVQWLMYRQRCRVLRERLRRWYSGHEIVCPNTACRSRNRTTNYCWPPPIAKLHPLVRSLPPTSLWFCSSSFVFVHRPWCQKTLLLTCVFLREVYEVTKKLNFLIRLLFLRTTYI